MSSDVIAIAGGTGGVGRTFVEVLEKEWKVIVLTRQPNATLPAVTVDYESADQLQSVLESHQVTAVISAISDVAGEAQLNLIHAACASRVTKRFIPTSYFIPYPRSAIPAMPTLANYFASLDLLSALPSSSSSDSLEWTVVHNGIFMDYLGQLPTNLRPACMIFDVAHRQIAIPGSGDDTIAMTYTVDVARYVSALLRLPAGTWPKEVRIAGDRVTFNQFVEIFENVTGTKLEVKYDAKEKLERGEITDLPSQAAMCYELEMSEFRKAIALMELWMIEGRLDIVPEAIQGLDQIEGCLTVVEMFRRMNKENEQAL